MIPALFFCRLELYEDDLFIPKVRIATSSLPPNIIYATTAYAQVANYTLVKWKLGDGEEFVTGENLWRDETPIATEGGFLSLYSPPEATPGTASLEEMSVWSLANSTVGAYGVPPDVAVGLRDPANTFYM